MLNYHDKKGKLTRLLCATIFLTNITQMPQLIGSGINKAILYTVWGMLVLNAVLSGRARATRFFSDAIVCALFFLGFCLLAGSISGHSYLRSSMVYPFVVSVFVFCIGGLCSTRLYDIDIEALYRTYLISGLLVSLAVYVSAFMGGYSVTGRMYAYESKNSVSQILLSVLILAVFFDYRKHITPFLRTVIALFMVFMLGILRSRASIIGIVVVAVYIFRSKDVKKGTKQLFSLAVIVGVLVVFLDSSAYDVVVNGILLGGRDVSNLNDVSSGRLYMLQEFNRVFSRYALTGWGSYYMESFPLSLLIQYGIVGALFPLLFCMLPIRIVKRCKVDKTQRIIVLLIICYYLNGLFEELSPLGPGVKCYLLWFLAGLKTYEAQYGVVEIGESNDTE